MAAPISSWRVAGTKWERLGIACTCGMALEKQGGSYSQAYSQGNGLLRRGTEYPMFDGHGSERTVTSSNQTVTGTANYEAFGQVAGSTGSSASPYMYAGDWGYRNDGDAGLMHVGARYYDAQVGRFITRDTVLSEHPYLYCEHEPVGFVDPSGHAPCGWTSSDPRFHQDPPWWGPWVGDVGAYLEHMLRNGVKGAVVGGGVGLIGGAIGGSVGGAIVGGVGAIPGGIGGAVVGGRVGAVGRFLVGVIGTPISDMYDWVGRKLQW